VIYKLNLMLF